MMDSGQCLGFAALMACLPPIRMDKTPELEVF